MAVITWAVACAVLLLLAWRDLGDGVDRLERARDAIDVDDLTSTAAAEALRDAGEPFARAEQRIGSPLLAPVKVAPIVGRQLRSVHALSSAAVELTAGGAEVTTDVRRAIIDAAVPERRIGAIAALETAMADALAVLRGIDLGPHEALVPALAERRDTLAIEIAEAEADLERGIALARAGRTVLAGPTRYLLLAANNAEMRAGSGMFLQAGTLEMRDGRIRLGDMRPTHELTLAEPVHVTGDLAERWGFTDLGREWRNLASSPRFPASAEVASRMWREATGETVDGVITIDVAAVVELVAATGPVEVGGVTVDSESAEKFLLHDQYQLIARGDAVQRDDSQQKRRDLLGDLAEEIVARIESGIDAGPAATAVRRAVRGRHVMLWSPRGEVQTAFTDASLAGDLTDHSVLLSVLNRGGNKLDPFLRIDATAERSEDAVSVRVDIENRTPDGEVPYVAGPGEGLDVAPGTYVGFVALNVPGDAAALEVSGGPLIVAGADGPTRVAATQIVLPRGELTTVTFRFALPGPAEVRIEPSARMPAARWHVGGRTFSDRGPTTTQM